MKKVSDSLSGSTVVLGASPNPSRPAHLAVLRLVDAGHTAIPIGTRNGTIGELDIIVDRPALDNVDTVNLYIGPTHQAALFPYILSLKPRRIIFNPGTENPELMKLAREAGIEVTAACSLVMLATGQYV